MDNVMDILRLAREKETVRQAAYEQAAAIATNPLIKATFSSLAGEEAKHARYVQVYYDKQVANEGWPAPEELGIDEDFAKVIEQIFHEANEAIKATAAEAKAELHEAYEAGIAAEQESVEFYSDALSQATDPNAIRFFTVLVKAEKLHYKLLSESQKFVDDPSFWFFEQEHWIVEG